MSPSCESIGVEAADQIFFSSNRTDLKYAARICRSCPLMADCLEMAMSGEEGLPASHRHGVFGGMIPSDRYRLEMTRGGGRKCLDCDTSIDKRPAIARRCVDCQGVHASARNRERMAARRERRAA